MLIMSFMNSEKEALDLPAIVTGNGEAYPNMGHRTKRVF